MSVLETTLVFVIIPLAVAGVLALLTLGAGGNRTPRYRPGMPFEFTPVWFLSAPPTGLSVDGQRPALEATAARGDSPEIPASQLSANQLTSIANGAAAAGPFSSRQLFRIDEALTAADRETGLTFSVYVGALDEPLRSSAEALLDTLPAPADSVLLAVSPNQRALEIVTGHRAAKRIPDRACELAGMSMRAAFQGGDLSGGIITGLRMLADRAARPARR